MDLVALLLAVATVGVASIVIMYASDSFEQASGFLGRNMPPGVRGATINAIGSSLPELMTTAFLLFVYHDRGGFSAGVATCAGSAIFNAVIIPALCIFAVSVFGVKRGKRVEKVTSVVVGRDTVLRDGLFFVFAEMVLIYFLSGTQMMWWMGGLLLAIYVLYFTFLMWQFRTGRVEPEDEDDDDDDDDEKKSWLKALLTFDFNQLFYGGRELSTGRAWVVLSAATLAIGVACHFLAGAVIDAADALQVPSYFTAVILAAAATSVPDTVLSVKDARAGKYDDAVSNAIGSNIFDITVALGLPLFAYGMVYGDISLSADSAGAAAGVQELRIALIITTFFVLALFLLGRGLGRNKALAMLGIYGVWTLFIFGRALEWTWIPDFSRLLVFTQ